MLIYESLALSAVIFVIGVLGVMLRRNAIVMFMCIELMLNAVNLSFVAISRYVGIEGHLFVIFIMTVAAAEAAVGLAIIISIFRHYESVDIRHFRLLRW
jgi:NADH-quinone oxidoreductase subunit K